MGYSDEIKSEARRLMIWEGYNARQASERLQEKHKDGPAESTIRNWAGQEDDVLDGRTWEEERQRILKQRYSSTSPEATARKILSKVHQILDEPGFDTERGDQLSKLSAHMRRFVDPRYHLSMTYQVLTRLHKYIRTHHPEVASADLSQAIRDFKTHERQRLEGE